MTTTLRRSGAFALVGSLALLAPLLGRYTAIPFAAIAVLAALVISEGPVFELFARPGDRQDRTLYGLAGFCLAATGLALLATIPVFGLPIPVFAAAVLILAYGNVAEQAVRTRDRSEIRSVTAFVSGGFLAGLIAQAVTEWLQFGSVVSVPELAFLAASGALLAGLLRTVLFERDDPLMMLSVGLLLWLLADINLVLSGTGVAIALALTAGLSYLSYVLDTASIPGMLTGAFLALVTIVLGGFAWFTILIAFFAIGGLSTKYRYEEKLTRGVAEANEGARGSANVLGNSAVALLAVLGFAMANADPPLIDVDSTLFLFGFAGSLAAALGDTLSSEIGGVFDDPRLITTGEPVEPGTDGGVTWQGELAGFVGSLLVGVIALALFDSIDPLGATAVLLGGVAGMTVDSLLGATLEGEWLGNQSVNFLATLSGGLVGVGIALAFGLTALS